MIGDCFRFSCTIAVGQTGGEHVALPVFVGYSLCKHPVAQQGQRLCALWTLFERTLPASDPRSH